MKSIILNLIAISFLLPNGLFSQNQLAADVYASYFGGSGSEYMTYITADNDRNVFIAGHGSSIDLPVKEAYQSVRKSSPDGFIAKFDPEMTNLIFCTYFGGNRYDEIKDIVTDAEGNIFITGVTESNDFPLTENAYDKTSNGGFDAFLSEFSPVGELLYSTYIGGSANDTGMRITAISPSSVILTGTTCSNDFPFNPAGSVINGGDDIFLLKLDLTTNNLEFSETLGGNEGDVPSFVTLDGQNNIYVCGSTSSLTFPLKDGLNNTYQGKQDGFICKLSSDGELIYSSLIGGDEYDQMVELAIDEHNDVYFMGGTSSPGLSCTSNAYSSDLSGVTDIILGKVNSSGDSLKYFSYYGGNDADIHYIVDYGDFINSYCDGKMNLLDDNKLIITGTTSSGDFDVSEGGYRKRSNSDIFVSVLSVDHSEVLYFSYFGSMYGDAGYGLDVLNDSTIVISGNVGPGFQVSSDAYMRTPNGLSEAIFARLTFHSAATGIQKNGTSPTGFQLYQNYPNPFNPSTQIIYALTASSKVELSVHNLLGQKTKTLVNAYQNAGEHSVAWDGIDESNNPVSSGVYFYQLTSNDQNEMKKMLLIR